MLDHGCQLLLHLLIQQQLPPAQLACCNCQQAGLCLLLAV
jgi:hypothetical protein